MLLNIGPYPPPLGGISVHLQRLKEQLDARKIPNRLWSLSRSQDRAAGIRQVSLKRLPLRMMLAPGIRIVHYHVSGLEPRRLAARLSRRHRSKRHVLTLHGDALRFVDGNLELAAEVLAAFDRVICVKEGDERMLREAGLKPNLVYVSPFLPPVDRDQPIDDPSIRQFMQAHRQVICANGSKIHFHANDELYGLDLCVEMMGRIRDSLPGVGFVFCLAKDNDPDYVSRIRARIGALGLQSRFLLRISSQPFFPIIRHSALMVRPTNTDGEPLSIREAFDLQVPVLTSDVVARPAACRLFRNRDVEDFALQVEGMLRNEAAERERLGGFPQVSGVEGLLALYRELGLPA